MEKYKIEVQEYLSKIIEIEANNIIEAISKVKLMYKKEEIVLNSEDFVLTEIKEFSE